MFLPFVILTFCCWGLYGPTMHSGQYAFGADGKLSAFRPFICVGISYFLIAVLFPSIMLKFKGEKGHWTMRGFVWSFAAGVVGAFGALGIILALKSGGKPIYVMPLVFGCAPVVNTFVTMAMARSFKEASWPFYIGILVVAIGAAGVLINKPRADHQHAEQAIVAPAATPASLQSVASTAPTTDDVAPAIDSVSDEATPVGETVVSWLGRALFILMTACCWGSYGPVLHKGQVTMGGSRLRPFLCVGLAYFAVAVLLPIILMPIFAPEPGSWSLTHNFMGYVWSLFAGAIGALGALGIIYAFNFGGKPIFVMPLVFGCAPVVNTFWEILSHNIWDQVQWGFYLSLFLVISGAVTVLIMAPKAHPKPVPPSLPPKV